MEDSLLSIFILLNATKGDFLYEIPNNFRKNLLLHEHEIGGDLGDPMGGCEDQELHHKLKVVYELLVPQSAVIDAYDLPLKLLNYL